MKPKLLIVDDDENIRSQLKWALSETYEVSLAENRAEAVAVFQEKSPPVVLLDLGLPPRPSDSSEGLAALAELIAIDRHVRVIIATGQSERGNALQAVGEGAYDFLCKPLEVDELRIILKRAYEIAQLEKEHREMQSHLNGDTFQGMLGGSPQMQAVFASIRRVASTDASVLILGESGTGKEMAAMGIHRLGTRKNGPFVAINCGAIPENLLESELFGHEKGAFTGAHIQRKGRIEMAHGGTLFLDEIGELSGSLQVKLLRFLQEQILERVGGRAPIQVDTRVIAATNSDLKKSMEEGKFREDLYYRLAVVVINLPPLRAREGDLPLLAQALVQKFASQNGKEAPKLTQEALRAIQHYEWPGNVRELENRIKRAVIMAEGRRMTPGDLELVPPAAAVPRSLKEAREELERDLVVKAMKKHHGKISPAAAELGVSRPTLYELLDKFGMKKEYQKESESA